MCRIMHVATTLGTFSNIKSMCFSKHPHLPFSLPNAFPLPFQPCSEGSCNASVWHLSLVLLHRASSAMATLDMQDLQELTEEPVYEITCLYQNTIILILHVCTCTPLISLFQSGNSVPSLPLSHMDEFDTWHHVLPCMATQCRYT